MAKTDFKRRHDVIESWIDWVVAGVAFIGWAFAITSFVVLLISISN